MANPIGIARKRTKAAPGQAAKAAGISVPELMAIEAGEVDPSPEVAKLLFDFYESGDETTAEERGRGKKGVSELRRAYHVRNDGKPEDKRG